jgi:hypothetical protein
MLYCFVIVYSVGKSSVPIYFSLNIMPELASFVILWVVVSESCRPYLDTAAAFGSAKSVNIAHVALTV